jgi:hypothetical protein
MWALAAAAVQQVRAAQPVTAALQGLQVQEATA